MNDAKYFFMQLNDPLTDEDGDILADLRFWYDKCAENRNRQLAQSSNKVVCRRPPEGAPKYAVGMVVKNKSNNWIGVIVSWDLRCTESDEWIELFSIRQLTRGVDQPFYEILGYHDSKVYVPEGNGDRHQLLKSSGFR